MKEKQEVKIVGPKPLRSKMTLDEFCVLQSTRDNRPETLSGFHFDETRAGRKKDTQAAYSERLQAFTRRPL